MNLINGIQKTNHTISNQPAPTPIPIFNVLVRIVLPKETKIKVKAEFINEKKTVISLN